MSEIERRMMAALIDATELVGEMVPVAADAALPADIAAAIERLAAEASVDPDCMSISAETRIRAARAALAAAILARLAAAEAERDEALREQKAVVLAEALRDAALARAERLEAALEAVIGFAEGRDHYDAFPRDKAEKQRRLSDCAETARAALSPAAE
jgi:hypothetical protein